MKKRVFSAIFVVIFSFISLGGRIYNITSSTEFASVQSHLRVRELGAKRGTIYDRNGEKLNNRKTKTMICAKPSPENAVIISNLKGEAFAEETVLKGYFTSFIAENVNHIRNSDTLKAYDIFERYSDSVALHLLGYTDIDGKGICGIEKHFNNELEDFSGSLSVVYSADAFGRMLMSENVETKDNNYYSEGGIMLTIDRDFQIIAEKALKNGNIDKGAAVVLDAETSAILACASAPGYERSDIEKYLSADNSPFLNRAFAAFPVGSVFKPITSAAALERGIFLSDFNCKGYIEKSGNKFNCNKLEGHGDIDFNTAIALSCNPYFIELSTQTGGEYLLSTAKKLGLGKEIDLGNGYITQSGILPDENELNSDAAVGNFGFGQGKLTASPLQIAACFAAFANGGIYNTPFVFKGIVDKNGSLTPNVENKGKRVLKESTCRIITDAMYHTNLDGTGKDAYTSLFDSCTKTATAQSGQYDVNGAEIKYCWFAGFFPYNNPKYVICILKENGSSGGIDGAPVFKEISENIYISDKSTEN